MIFLEGLINMVDHTPLDNETPHNVRLTAPEIANLWLQYQNDRMTVCAFKYILGMVEDVSNFGLFFEIGRRAHY
jgi:hypothetical protein